MTDTIKPRFLTIKEFAAECDCTYEAIRKKIGTEIIPESHDPVMIDSMKYDFYIIFKQNQANAHKS